MEIRKDSIAAPILAFSGSLDDDDMPGELKECSEQEFLLLLAAIPALRKTPGLPSIEELGDAYFVTLPRCADEKAEAATLEHLKTVFGIENRQQLLEYCERYCRLHEEYLDFEAVWDERPNFPLEALNEESRKHFDDCMAFSRELYPMAGRHGYLAWDISETIGMLRVGYACGLLSEADFYEFAGSMLPATESFHSFNEYAVNLLCGAAYFDFHMDCTAAKTQAFIDFNAHLLTQLLNDERAWWGRSWYYPANKKKFFIPGVDMRPLLRDWEGPAGCIATDRITVDGCRVGYMYREQPKENTPDSGWRFFAGDEDESYTGDPKNADVYHLNTICNDDPSVLPLLAAPFGTAFIRDEKGNFQREDFIPPEN